MVRGCGSNSQRSLSRNLLQTLGDTRAGTGYLDCPVVWNEKGSQMAGCQEQRGRCPQFLHMGLENLATEDYKDLPWECLED